MNQQQLAEIVHVTDTIAVRIKPFVIFLVIVFITGCLRTTPCEKEIYILPQGFHGKIIVFFDQPDGQNMHYENDARVYQIPSSGLLKSQFKRNGGCMDDNRIQFFYEDSLMRRVPVDYFLNIDKDTVSKERDYVLLTLFSEKKTKPDFVIHLLGKADEFDILARSVRDMDPVKVLNELAP
jgi:hypothetical protein